MLRKSLISTIFLACACSSSGAPGDGVGGQNGTVSADIDGQHFESAFEVVAPVGGTLGFSAVAANRATLAIVIDGTTTGTYPVEPGSRNEILFSDDTDQVLATGDRGSGLVTVTTLTASRFAGTFSGMLTDASGDTVRVVTNGTFDIDR